MLALLKLDRALAACKTLAKQAWELAGATELVFKKRERLFGWSDAVVRQNGDMFEDPKRVPGNLGFDPLKFGDNAATRDRLELQELTHGRLAMIAFAGMIHQVFVTGKPVLASLGEIFAA